MKINQYISNHKYEKKFIHTKFFEAISKCVILKEYCGNNGEIRSKYVIYLEQKS